MASRGVNKVILVGNLGQDPEMRYMPNGGAVANLRLATSESWRDKATGEQKEVTEWHTVVIFGKLAEIAGEYLRKGSQVYIEGQLRTRKWQDKDQQDRYSTEIVVSMNGVMQMLGGRRDGGQPQNTAPQQPAQPQSPAAPAQPAGSPEKSPKNPEISRQIFFEKNEVTGKFEDEEIFFLMKLWYFGIVICCKSSFINLSNLFIKTINLIYIIILAQTIFHLMWIRLFII